MCILWDERLNIFVPASNIENCPCILIDFLEVCHEEGKEDQLGEIHLEIQHQKSVSEFASELASISARWLASSAIAL